MALPKITTADVQNCYVQGQPDKLTGTAQQNKAVFDALPQMIVGKHNDIIDTLNSTDDGDSGADNIAATEIKPGGEQTVQGILDDLGGRVDAADRITALLATIQSIGPVQNDDTVLPTAKDVLEAMAAAGLGDMLKAYYDPNNNGDKVAKAENADKLGNKAPTDFVEYADLDATPTANSTNAVQSGGTYTAIKESEYHRNLLDNPYFKIDQKSFYVILPNKTYYTDSALTQNPITVSDYTQMYGCEVHTNYIKFILTFGGDSPNTTQYYVAKSDCIRGYCTHGISVDRWFNTIYGSNTHHKLTLNGDILLDITDDFYQTIKNSDLLAVAGKPMTISMLADGEILSHTFEWVGDGQNHGHGKMFTQHDNISFNIIENWGNYHLFGINIVSTTIDHNIGGIKLEEGTISTLEYDLARMGNYNYVDDLNACLQYQYYIPESGCGYGYTAANTSVDLNTPVIMKKNGKIRANGAMQLVGNGTILGATPDNVGYSVDGAKVRYVVPTPSAPQYEAIVANTPFGGILLDGN